MLMSRCVGCVRVRLLLNTSLKRKKRPTFFYELNS